MPCLKLNFPVVLPLRMENDKYFILKYADHYESAVGSWCHDPVSTGSAGESQVCNTQCISFSNYLPQFWALLPSSPKSYLTVYNPRLDAAEAICQPTTISPPLCLARSHSRKQTSQAWEVPEWAQRLLKSINLLCSFLASSKNNLGLIGLSKIPYVCVTVKVN